MVYDINTNSLSVLNKLPTKQQLCKFHSSSHLELPSPPASSSLEVSAAKFALDIFNWGLDNTLTESSSATPYDDFQFLSSSGPVLPDISQLLSTDLTSDYGLFGNVGAEFGIGGFWQRVKPLMEQSPLVMNGAPGADADARQGSLEKVIGGEGDRLARGWFVCLVGLV